MYAIFRKQRRRAAVDEESSRASRVGRTGGCRRRAWYDVGAGRTWTVGEAQAKARTSRDIGELSLVLETVNAE